MRPTIKTVLVFLLVVLVPLLIAWSLRTGTGNSLSPEQAAAQDTNRATSDLEAFEQELEDPATRQTAQEPETEVTTATQATEPTADWTVSGRLRLGKTGVYPGGKLLLRAYPGRTPKGEPLHNSTTITGDDGTFTWSIPTPTSTITVVAEPKLEGHKTGAGTRIVILGDPPPTDLNAYAYAMDCEVIGQVVDIDGQGMPDVLVECTMNQARTDALGHFRVPITTLMDKTTFEVLAPSYAPGKFTTAKLKPGENRVPNITLLQGVTLKGTVQTEQGAPIPGAAVHAWPPKHSRTTTDEFGAFELNGLNPKAKRLPVSASKAGFVEATKTLRRPKEGWPSLQDLTLTLTTGASATGTVQNEQGTPIADAWVTSGIHPRRAGGKNAKGTYTDAQGRFTIPDLKPGTHSLWASRRSYAPTYIQIEIPNPATDQKADPIILTQGYKFWGKVLDPSGNPIPGALLYSQAAKPNGQDSDTFTTSGADTNQQGYFEFPNARHDTIALQVFADGYENLKQEIYAGEETLLYPKRKEE